MRFIAFAALCALAACTGDSEPASTDPDPTACDRVRDHAIELRLAAAGPGHEAELDAHRAALAAASAGAAGDCRAHHSDDEIACQLAAANLDAYRACTEELP